MANINLLQQIEPPALPQATNQYDRPYQDQLNNVHRLFYNRLTNGYNALVGTHGGRLLQFPYGAFQSHSTQTLTTINTPTLVTFDVTDYSEATYYTAGNGIHVDHNGVYNVQFSVQLTNDDTRAHDYAIWLRIDGVDVPWTSSVATVPSKHGGIPGYYVLAANFFVQMQAGEYLEFWWAANDLAVTMNALPPITTPFVNPGAPSVVATVAFVSNLP
jgi:hypothetical protein